MPVARLLREQTIGETRWAALDARGEPVALYLERGSDARRAVIGDRAEARIRKIDAGPGGAFADLGAKGEAFLRLKSGETYAEGAGITVDVVAEARRNKLARVRVADPATAPGHGAAHWRASLTGGLAALVEDRAAGDADVQAAFDDAQQTTVILPGGGRLRPERTEALIAADIDTAGRMMRGGRAAAARALNLEAAAGLARQILIRGWGGLCVMDCVSPINQESGASIRTAFLAAFRDVSSRQVKALAPSEFGLMEISADWQLTPLSERLNDAGGQRSPETLALDGLRHLEARARAERIGRLTLCLPRAAFAWLGQSGLDAGAQLAEIYGARLTIAPGETAIPEVRQSI